MGDSHLDGHKCFRKLMRTAYTGYILLFSLVGIVGGTNLLISGSGVGLVLSLVGLALLVFRFSRAFNNLADRGVAWTGFPVLTLLLNLLFIFMTVSVAAVYISDPFVLHNRGNTFGLILWSAATLISIGMLVANLLAYRLDRRLRN